MQLLKSDVILISSYCCVSPCLLVFITLTKLMKCKLDSINHYWFSRGETELVVQLPKKTISPNTESKHHEGIL